MHEAKQPGHGAGSWRGRYAEWIAVGALVAGSVGALIGARQCTHRNARRAARFARSEDAAVTAPHGDKLETALR
jgi:hypothetical protein